MPDEWYKVVFDEEQIAYEQHKQFENQVSERCISLGFPRGFIYFHLIKEHSRTYTILFPPKAIPHCIDLIATRSGKICPQPELSEVQLGFGSDNEAEEAFR